MDHDQVVRMTQMIEEAVTFGIRNGLPDAKERRRYQLLQAAALILTAHQSQAQVGDGDVETVTQTGEAIIESCVDEAEQLLDEIERRES